MLREHTIATQGMPVTIAGLVINFPLSQSFTVRPIPVLGTGRVLLSTLLRPSTIRP